jgi:hypothetical protein
MPGIATSKTSIPFSKLLLPYWTHQLNFYELWKVVGEGTFLGLIKLDPMTVIGTGLNAIYAVPDNATYKALDTDYVFHKSDGSVSTACDGNRLIAYDFPRIIVKYLDVSPYTIEYIGILDLGQSVNNKMRDDFHLSIWWSNTLSFHGSTKTNRVIGQSVWTSELIAPAIPTGLTVTLISGGVKWDWTAGDVAAQTELWCRNDSGTSALAYTIAAGVVTKSETTDPVDLRYCKIRSLKGGLYSAFTSEVSIAMLGAEMIPGTWADVNHAWWALYWQAGWSADGTKILCNGSSGYIGMEWFWLNGKKYKIVVHTTGTGNIYIDGSEAASAINVANLVSTTYYTVTAQYVMTIFASGFNGTITSLSIKNVLMP